MGINLADEILTHIETKVPSLLYPSAPGRISFIGHSAGGLVIRRALEEERLAQLRPKFHTYISLASPHVGVLFMDSQLVSTGMWTFFQFNRSALLKELMLEDHGSGDIRNSLLYKLSDNGALQYFKRVVLVSSPKDQYVPLYSARVQVRL